jgi:hypothetical protein
VFGPYALNDEFGSRAINPMELYHNQVTRQQGPFSLRMFHRSWGIMMIQANIEAPCTVLDFPTRERFVAELKAHHYDVVGISSIIVNVAKVAEMCRLTRQVSPRSTIVVGGHVAAIADIEQRVDADYVVKGDGIGWMRRFLGQNDTAPVRHPVIASGFGLRALGVSGFDGGDTAATIIPSAGCPLGCNFCTTSAFFGGKGRMVSFYKKGADLFEVMREAEARLGTPAFFMMDENFLLDRRRAMELLDLMKRESKSWALYVFSSANALGRYTMRELVELGISWVWMGLESAHSRYSKLKGVDTKRLTQELRSHGIKTLGSTIVGLEHHTRDNIELEIEQAAQHDTDFHQFMLYTPIPGTPLYRQIEQEGRLLDVDLADTHGQYQFNFEHRAISAPESKKFLDWAFLRDYERNGPSLYRICRTTLEGWKRYRDDPDERVRRRFVWESRRLRDVYCAMLWAMERRLRAANQTISVRIGALRREVEQEFGIKTLLVGRLLGPVLAWTAGREEKRLAAGLSLEPPTIVERRNWQPAGRA